MNNSLSLSKLIPVSLVLFSSFFGAGNLLFPPLFGYLAGSNLNIATLGFCITGVSLPILGVLAIAMTGGTDLTEVAAPVNIAYAKIIMFLSSMAIGPLFAIPRTAAFSYEIGIKPLLGTTEAWQLALYSALYFAFSFYVANNPSKVLNWLGKILTPALLVCLAVLFAKVLLAPSFVPGAPQDAYLNTPFLKGFQEGYNTMDLLASFLFGAATLTSIKTLGIEGKKNLIRITSWGMRERKRTVTCPVSFPTAPASLWQRPMNIWAQAVPLSFPPSSFWPVLLPASVSLLLLPIISISCSTKSCPKKQWDFWWRFSASCSPTSGWI